MRYPEFLPQNGTIGFVAPSFGCAGEPYYSAFVNAQRKFKGLGYGLKLGPNCYEAKGVGISNTPEACAEEIMEYYCSEENDCLISCGGGELMCEILSFIDFDRMKQARPKWCMGYSDNTNMTYLLATLCDTASIYGPCAAAFGMEPWHSSLDDAMGLLSGKKDKEGKLVVRGYGKWERESLKNEDNPLAPYNVTQDLDIKVFLGRQKLEKTDQTVNFRGRLLGGCMDCLVNLLGTRFDKTHAFIEKYKKDGIIWFLEACDLNVFAIRRAMWQMEEAGWFQYVKGFLIGRPLCLGQEIMGLDAYGAVLKAASRHNVPVVMDVDLGHLPPMMPVVVGSIGEVSVQGNNIALDYRLQ
nr:LD-carboxypeptidase [uncultured Acetatifactor sp.]